MNALLEKARDSTVSYLLVTLAAAFLIGVMICGALALHIAVSIADRLWMRPLAADA